VTVETTPLLTEPEARRLTERIRYTALSVRDGVEKLQRLVAEAQSGQAHLALGYKSWTAYLAEVMGDEPLVLARDRRRDVVAWLAGEGMSTRAIGAVVGASVGTVHSDKVFNSEHLTADEEAPSSAVRAEVYQGDTPAVELDRSPALSTRQDVRGGRNLPGEGASSPAVVSSDQPADEHGESQPRAADLPPFDPTTGEVLDEPAPRPAVLGLDGKSYTRPEPKPRRTALIDAVRPQAERVWSTAIELRGAVGDDRFVANRASISEVVLPRVRSAALDLTAFLAELDLSSAVETEEARARLVTDLNHISETFARLARSLMEEPK